MDVDDQPRETTLSDALSSRAPFRSSLDKHKRSMFEVAEITDSTVKLNAVTGDGALLPPPFHGLPSENVHEWNDYFTRYIRYKRLNADQALELFVVLLRGSAATAFSTLDEAAQSDHAKVSRWFDDRYKFSPRRKFKLGQELFLRKQLAGETVDDYFVAIQSIARQIDDKPSDEIIRFAISSGLRPNIAGHVMAFAAKAESIDELLEAARVAELMTAATPDASAVETLIAEVKRLGDRIDASTTRSVSQTRSPSAERRQVTFTDRAPTPPPIRQQSESFRPAQPAAGRYYQGNNYQGQQPETNGMRQRCSYCWGLHGPNRTDCFGHNKACFICSKIGHLAKCCRSRPNNMSYGSQF